MKALEVGWGDSGSPSHCFRAPEFQACTTSNADCRLCKQVHASSESKLASKVTGPITLHAWVSSCDVGLWHRRHENALSLLLALCSQDVSAEGLTGNQKTQRG